MKKQKNNIPKKPRSLDDLTVEQRAKLLFKKCKTREELSNFIQLFFGFYLPDYTVSRYADTNPLNVIWEVYDICINNNNPEEIDELLYVAARGSGKTLGMAIAEILVVLHDQRDVCHVGAVMAQAKRCYEYQTKFLMSPKIRPIIENKKLPLEKRILQKMNMEKSIFKMGDSVNSIEVLPCTLSATNGPHVPFVCIGGKTYIDISLKGKEKKVTAEELFKLFHSGEKVLALSYDVDNDEYEYKEILNAYDNGSHKTLNITTDKGNSLSCTSEHLIWKTNIRGYIPAKDLAPKDSILSTNGIDSLSSISQPSDESENVYDFNVKDNHNFFAGGVLVHNCTDEIDTVSGEGLKAFKEISGMIDSKGGKRALRVGISTRKSRYGLMNKMMEDAEHAGRYVRRWTAFEFAERCPDKRSGTTPTPSYHIQDEMEVITEEDYQHKNEKKKKEYTRHIMPGEKCLTCPAASICLGDAKKQKSKSWMLKPISDVIAKVRAEGADWSLSQLMNLKPSVEGIIYKEFSEKQHVKNWNDMWYTLTGTEYPGDCSHDVFVKKCHAMNLQCYAGVDWGWSNPCTVVYFFVDRRDNIYVVRADGMTYVSQPEWVHYIKHKYHTLYRCQLYFPDIADQGAVTEMRKAGLPVSNDNDKAINTGIQVIKKHLKIPGQVGTKIHIAAETCGPLVQEFLTYHFKTSSDGTVTEMPESENDHWLDALRYAMTMLFGKGTMVMGNGMSDDDSANITDNSGHYYKTPTAEEFARQNGVDVDTSTDKSKLGKVGKLSDLDDDDDEWGGDGSFLWSL